MSKKTILLLAFPYAGGSASIFRSWQSYLPYWIKICGINYRGRGSRINQKAFTSSMDIVDEVVVDYLKQRNISYALFGHSMGAMIAFDFATRVTKLSGIKPLHLFISGLAAPHKRTQKEYISQFDDDDFIDAMARLGGTHTDIFNNPDLIKILLPAMRADMQLADNWSVDGTAILDIPITIFGGSSDNEVPVEELHHWSKYTTLETEIIEYSGGHFFINDHYQKMARDIHIKLRGSL